jgi:hypothetical protein
LTVNAQFKTMMKDRFVAWYSQQLAEDLKKHADLKLSIIKPIHARWMIDVFTNLRQQESLIKSGFSKAGI